MKPIIMRREIPQSSPWLYTAAFAPAGNGVLTSMAGLFGWHIHSDFIAGLS